MLSKVLGGISVALLASNAFLFNKTLTLKEEVALTKSLLDEQNRAIEKMEVDKEALNLELKELDGKVKKAYTSLSKERKTCEQRMKRLEESFVVFENLLKGN